MINIVNLKKKEEGKEFKVAIPNFLFDADTEEEDTKMQQLKVVHLYYSLMLKTPMAINILENINLNILCTMSKIKATSSTLEDMKKRLNYLERKNLIKLSTDISTFKKNELFDIEMIAEEQLISNGFTFLTESDIKTFNSLNNVAGTVFLYMKRYYNSKIGYAFPSFKDFCKSLGASTNSLAKAIKELKEKGLIEVENPNFYSNDKNGNIRRSNNTYSFKSQEDLAKEKEEAEKKAKLLEQKVKEMKAKLKAQEESKINEEEVVQQKHIEIPSKFQMKSATTSVKNSIKDKIENLPNEIPF